ncbi:MAG: hypothetical protein Q8K37_01315, partial [Alphaproteobacteria bacterium]|nr:hypothetical protein [Alphaproteobacteria bacterium]
MICFLKKIIYFVTINIFLILNSFQNNAECNDFVIKFEIKTKDLIKNKINNIFELTDEFGKKIISIVHLNSWQTTRSSNPYGVIFSVHPEFLEKVIEEHFIYDNPFKGSTGTGLMIQDECLYSYPINRKLNENNFLLKYGIDTNKFFSLDEIQFSPYYTFSNDTVLSGDRKNIKFTNFPDLKESLSGAIGNYLLSGNFICFDFIVDKESDPDAIGFVALKMYKFSTDENKWNFLH